MCSFRTFVLPALCAFLLNLLHSSFAEAATVQDDIKAARRSLDSVAPDAPNTGTLDTSNFKAISTGAWFVDFYAPWCPHCRDLEPEWKKLASAVPEGVRLAKVNCDAHRELCSDVDSMPTIRLYRGGQAKEYQGQREEDDMRMWLRRQMMDNVEPFEVGGLELALKKHPAMFLFLYRDGAAGQEDRAALQSFIRAAGFNNDLGVFAVSKSPDVLAAIRQHEESLNIPAIVFAFADERGKLARVLPFPSSLSDSAALEAWILQQGDKMTVHELHGGTAGRLVFNDEPGLLVLAIVTERDRSKLPVVQKALHVFRKLEADKYGAKAPKKPVRFAYVDPEGPGEEYLRDVLRINRYKHAKVVVVDPYEDGVYEVDSAGKEIQIDLDQIANAALAAQSGAILQRYYRTAKQRRERRVRRAVEGFLWKFKMALTVAFLLIVILGLWMVCKFAKRRLCPKFKCCGCFAGWCRKGKVVHQTRDKKSK